MGVDYYAYEHLTYVGLMPEPESKALHPITGKRLAMSRQQTWGCEMRALVHPKTGKRLNVHRLVLVGDDPTHMYLYSGRERWVAAGSHGCNRRWGDWLENLVAFAAQSGGRNPIVRGSKTEPFEEWWGGDSNFIDHVACAKLVGDFRAHERFLEKLPTAEDDRQAGFHAVYREIASAVEFAKNGGGIRISY